MSLSEEAGEGAPGDPVMLRKLKSAIAAFEMSLSGKLRLPKGLQSAGWVAKRTASANLLIGDAPLPFAAVISAIATLDNGDGPLRATLVFAGQPLVEDQAWHAAQAAAGHSSIPVNSITPPPSRTRPLLNPDD